MITTNEMELFGCDDCEGKGTIEKRIECLVCDHHHDTVVRCEWCDGEGVRAYFKTVFDPNCEYCFGGLPHPLRFSLPTIEAARGSIKFWSEDV